MRWSSLYVNRWSPYNSNWYGSFSITYTLPENGHPPTDPVPAPHADGRIEIRYDGKEPIFIPVEDSARNPFGCWNWYPPMWCWNIWWWWGWGWCNSFPAPPITTPPTPPPPIPTYSIDTVKVDGIPITLIYAAEPVIQPNGIYLVYPPDSDTFYLGGLTQGQAYSISITDTAGVVLLENRYLRAENNPYVPTNYENAPEVIPMEEVLSTLEFWFEGWENYEARARLAYKPNNIPSAGENHTRVVVYDIIKKGSLVDGGTGGGFLPGVNSMNLICAEYNPTNAKLFIMTRVALQYKVFFVVNGVWIYQAPYLQAPAYTEWNIQVPSTVHQAIVTTQNLQGIPYNTQLSGVDWTQAVWCHLDLQAGSGGGGGMDIAYNTTTSLTTTIGGSTVVPNNTVTPTPNSSSVGSFIVDRNGVIARIDAYNTTSGLTCTTVATSLGIPDVPLDGQKYVRWYNGTTTEWTPAPTGGGGGGTIDIPLFSTNLRTVLTQPLNTVTTVAPGWKVTTLFTNSALTQFRALALNELFSRIVVRSGLGTFRLRIFSTSVNTQRWVITYLPQGASETVEAVLYDGPDSGGTWNNLYQVPVGDLNAFIANPSEVTLDQINGDYPSFTFLNLVALDNVVATSLDLEDVYDLGVLKYAQLIDSEAMLRNTKADKIVENITLNNISIKQHMDMNIPTTIYLPYNTAHHIQITQAAIDDYVSHIDPDMLSGVCQIRYGSITANWTIIIRTIKDGVNIQHQVLLRQLSEENKWDTHTLYDSNGDVFNNGDYPQINDTIFTNSTDCIYVTEDKYLQPFDSKLARDLLIWDCISTTGQNNAIYNLIDVRDSFVTSALDISNRISLILDILEDKANIIQEQPGLYTAAMYFSNPIGYTNTAPVGALVQTVITPADIANLYSYINTSDSKHSLEWSSAEGNMRFAMMANDVNIRIGFVAEQTQGTFNQVIYDGPPDGSGVISQLNYINEVEAIYVRTANEPWTIGWLPNVIQADIWAHIQQQRFVIGRMDLIDVYQDLAQSISAIQMQVARLETEAAYKIRNSANPVIMTIWDIFQQAGLIGWVAQGILTVDTLVTPAQINELPDTLHCIFHTAELGVAVEIKAFGGHTLIQITVDNVDIDSPKVIYNGASDGTDTIYNQKFEFDGIHYILDNTAFVLSILDRDNVNTMSTVRDLDIWHGVQFAITEKTEDLIDLKTEYNNVLTRLSDAILHRSNMILQSAGIFTLNSINDRVVIARKVDTFTTAITSGGIQQAASQLSDGQTLTYSSTGGYFQLVWARTGSNISIQYVTGSSIASTIYNGNINGSGVINNLSTNFIAETIFTEPYNAITVTPAASAVIDTLFLNQISVSISTHTYYDLPDRYMHIQNQLASLKQEIIRQGGDGGGDTSGFANKIPAYTAQNVMLYDFVNSTNPMDLIMSNGAISYYTFTTADFEALKAACVPVPHAEDGMAYIIFQSIAGDFKIEFSVDPTNGYNKGKLSLWYINPPDGNWVEIRLAEDNATGTATTWYPPASGAGGQWVFTHTNTTTYTNRYNNAPFVLINTEADAYIVKQLNCWRHVVFSPLDVPALDVVDTYQRTNAEIKDVTDMVVKLRGVVDNNAKSGLSDAPADNKLYGRKNNTWTDIAGTGIAGRKYATVVIGTSQGGTTTNPTDVDFYCDGTNDSEMFGNAISAVETAGGGTIIVREGQYNLTDSIYIAVNNIRILGAGPATKINICTTLPAENIQEAAVFQIMANFVEIRDMYISTLSDIANEFAVPGYATGMYISDSNYVTISDVTFAIGSHGTGEVHGVYITDSSFLITIRDCIVGVQNTCTLNNIELVTSGIDASGGSVIIQDCTVSTTATYYTNTPGSITNLVYVGAVYLEGSDCKVLNCNVSVNASSVTTDGAELQVYGIVCVHDATISDCYININGALNATTTLGINVIYSSVSVNNSDTLMITRNTITGMSQGNYQGILIETSASARFYITDNTLFNYAMGGSEIYGIYCTTTVIGVIAKNIVRVDGMISDTISYFGIRVVYGQFISVVDNIIECPGRGYVTCYQGNATIVQGNQLRGTSPDSSSQVESIIGMLIEPAVDSKYTQSIQNNTFVYSSSFTRGGGNFYCFQFWNLDLLNGIQLINNNCIGWANMGIAESDVTMPGSASTIGYYAPTQSTYGNNLYP